MPEPNAPIDSAKLNASDYINYQFHTNGIDYQKEFQTNLRRNGHNLTQEQIQVLIPVATKPKVENTGCSPLIWRKYNDTQRTYWNHFYKAFHVRELLPTHTRLSQENMDILAHNLACQAVDVLAEMGIATS